MIRGIDIPHQDWDEFHSTFFMHLSPSVKNGYRADIDGIRSIAALSVIFFHLNPDWLPGGFLGVDVFFVVSGYLITGIILRENHSETFTFANFFARRIKRIFPALFTVLIFSAAIGIFLLHPVTYQNFMTSSRYASAQLANFFFARHVGYFDEGFVRQPLLHLWTLGVEEQFYLFWPLLIVVLFRRFRSQKSLEDGAGKPGGHLFFLRYEKKFLFSSNEIDIQTAWVFLALAILSYLTCFILTEENYNLAFYMFYSRAWEFCLGGFVALGSISSPGSKKTNTVTSIAGLLLLVLSVFLVKEEFLQRSFLQFGVILPCLGTVLLIYSNNRMGPANRLLSTRIPVFIGRVSYSLYLFHWPIIIFYKNFYIGSELSPAAAAGIICATFILATLSYYLIEQPARKTRMVDRYVIYSAFFAIIFFTAGFKSLEAYDTAPWRIQRYSAEKRDPYNAHPVVCETKTKGPVKYKDCRIHKNADRPYVALVGDSHAIHYLKATVFWAKEAGFDVIYFSAAGCPMLLGEVHFANNIKIEDEKRCDEALSFFKTDIVDNEKIQHILLAQRFDLMHNGKGFPSNKQISYFFRDANGNKIKDHTGYYRDQLNYTVEQIQKTGKGMTILKQVPLFPGNWDCEWEPRLKKWLTPGNLCSYNRQFIEKWQRPSIDFIDDFIKTHGLRSFDPGKYLHKPRVHNRSLYENTDHLNGNGCQFLVPYFVKEMKEVMNDKTDPLSVNEPEQ